MKDVTTAVEHQRSSGIALILLLFAQFIVVLDATIVNIALPSIGDALGFSQENLSWVINAYILTFGGGLLLGGRLADLLGRRRVFITGMVLIAVASLAAGFADSVAHLIAARAAQGLAAAIIAPSALSIVTAIFRDGAERNKALGAWGAISGSAGAAGVLLGGVLTDGLGWQWVLWVNVPIAVVVAALASRWIPESRVEGPTRRFDIGGAVTGSGGLAVMVYAIVNAADVGWGSARTVGLLAVAAVLLAMFIGIEKRAVAPLVPFRIFRVRSLTGANVVGLLVGGAVVSMFFFITLYMQQVLGYSPVKAGIAYLPLAVMIIVSSGVASQLVTRFGVRSVFATGLGLVAVALLWLSRAPVDGGYATDILGPSLVAGAGFGLAFVPMTIAAVSGVQEQESGLASGLINTSQQIGGAFGLAVLATIAASRTNNLLARGDGDPAALPNALNAGFHNAFVGGAVIAALGVVLALAIIRTRNDDSAVEAPSADENLVATADGNSH